MTLIKMDYRNRINKAVAIPVGIVGFAVVFYYALLAPPNVKGSKDVLAGGKVLKLDDSFAPESVDFDPNGGGPYVGVSDGRILKWENDDVGWVEFAVSSPFRKSYCFDRRGDPVREPRVEHICGRPLGVHFNQKTGDLYICDCYLGLKKVGPKGGVAESLLKVVEDRPLHFTNHLDIDEDNDVIYFTDSSLYYSIRSIWDMYFSNDFTGRLIRYDMKTGEAKTILGNLHFPNGVALSKDKSFVLVAESTSSRIYRVWLTGPKSGSSDIFAEVVGPVDNIRRNANGEFWMAVHTKNTPFAQILSGSAFLKRALLFIFNHNYLALDYYVIQQGHPNAVAVKYSEKGEVLETLEDTKGKKIRTISEVTEFDGKLWFGSITEPQVGVFDLNDLKKA